MTELARASSACTPSRTRPGRRSTRCSTTRAAGRCTRTSRSTSPSRRASCRGSLPARSPRRDRRAARDSAVRERARARVRHDRPSRLPVLHPVRPDEGRASRSTSWCRHPPSTADRGWRARAPSSPRTRCCTGSPREFGLPEGAGGVFMQGGTIGNLSALVTARDAARRRNREAGVADPARWAVVCSAEAHSSITSAAAVMDVDVIGAPPGRRRATSRRGRRSARSTSTARPCSRSSRPAGPRTSGSSTTSPRSPP